MTKNEMLIHDKLLIQELTNALANSRKYVYAASKNSESAEEVYEELVGALRKASDAGYINTNPQKSQELY